MRKIKLDIAIFWDRIGGITEAKLAGEEVRHLNKLGIDAELLLIEQQIPAKFKDFLYDLKIDALESQVPKIFRVNFRIPGFSFFSLSHLTSPLYSPLVLRRKYDIIISHGTFACFTARNLRKYRGLPYLAHIWDPISYILQKAYVQSPIYHFQKILVPLGTSLDRLILEEAEAIILPSKYHMNRMGKLTEKSIEVVYPGVNSATKVPSKRDDYILAVARWERGKKPFFLLALLEGLKKRGTRATLVMVGRWKTQRIRESFFREAKSRNVLNQIINLKEIDETTLSRYYFGARMLVHPITESFGMIGLEAAAHGAPIIIPKRSGVTDLFNDGVHGFFPEEEDLDSFVEHAEILLSNERRAWKMGFDAWQVARKYTWTNHARRLYEVVKKYI